MTKIALITDSFKIGGGLEHIRLIARSAQEFSFGIFGQGGTVPEALSKLPNVTVFDTGYDLQTVMQYNPDVIHIHHLRPLLALCGKPWSQPLVPILFTAHGLHIHKYEFLKGFKNRFQHLARFALERYLFSRVDAVIVVSREDGAFVKTRYALDSIYIPNGVDHHAIEAAGLKVDLRRSLGLPQHGPIVLTVARFSFQKGHEILIRAISRIKDTVIARGATFVFIGDGELLESARLLATSLSVQDYILFLGLRTNTYNYMHASDLFVLPSRWEGLPFVLIEAGLCGLPVIASETYGNREVIRNGNDGILFRNGIPEELARVLQNALNDPDSFGVYGTNLQRSVRERYNLNQMISRLRGLYQLYARRDGSITP